MTTIDILATLLTVTGKTKAQIGRALGVDDKDKPSKATDTINKRMKLKNPSVNTLIEMLNVMGYTLVVVPSGSKLKDGEYEVSIYE